MIVLDVRVKTVMKISLYSYAYCNFGDKLRCKFKDKS